METLQEKIMNEIACFSVKNGVPPIFIYLGHNEIKELKSKKLGDFDIKKIGRNIVYGLQVYEVDCDEHLNLAGFCNYKKYTGWTAKKTCK